jgi:uncharacterized membrane protein YqjE
MRIGKAFSVFGLADRFRQEVAILVKDEVQLAKVEMSEKMAVLKRNVIALGVGAFVAFAGLVLLSLAAGRLLALAFLGLGWSESLSNFVGIATAGLVIALVGLIFVLKGVKTLSQSSLKPERTIETLRDLRAGDGQIPAAPKLVEPKALQPSKEELASRIDHTRSELKETMHKARKRLAWGSAAALLGRQVRRHPLRMLVIGAGAGLARQALRHRRAKHKVIC